MNTKYLTLLVTLLFSVCHSVKAQTTYYYDGSGNLNDRTNWGPNTNGSGADPANFTANNQVFEIRNTTSVSLNNNWTVSGTGSKIVIGNSAVAAITVSHTGGDWNATVDIAAASSGTNRLDLQQTNANTPTLGTLNSGSTVTYTRGGAQTVQGVTYGNLTIGGSSGTKTAGAAVGVSGTLTINASRIFNMSTFALTGALTPSGTGTLQTANTSSTPIPADEVWTGAVTYNSASGQTIVSGTYPTLTASGGTRTFSSTGTIIISGTFTPGSSNYTIGTSTVRYTTATANMPVPAVASGGNYYNLEISSGIWTLSSTFTIANNLIVNGGTFHQNNATSNTVTINGNLTVSSGIYDANPSNSGTSVLNLKGNLSVTGGVLENEGIVANLDFRFNGTGTQTFANTTPENIRWVNFTVESGSVLQLNSNMPLELESNTFRGVLTALSGGTINMQSFTIEESDFDISAGTITVDIQSGGSLITSNSSGINGSMPGANTTKTLSSGGNYEFRGAVTGTFTTTPTANTVNNLTVNNASGVTLSQAFTVAGTLGFTTGALLLNGTTLTINAGITGTSSFTGSSTSSISVGGSGAIGSNINMTATSSSTRTLQNFTVNRSGQTITLGAVMEVTGTVTVTAGTLASAGNLTIISTASADGRIANSAGSITGNVTIQKYIPAGSARRWLHIGSPVSSFTWDQVFDDVLISGPGAGGFDANGTNYPSAYYYNENVSGDCGPNGWAYPTNVSNSVPAGKGLKMFFRGDRDPARLAFFGAPSPNAVTMDFVGTVNSGTQNMNVTYTNNGNSTWDGWNFVSNPYPSAIDWDAASGWTKTNISATIYVWNAESKVYATWNGVSGTNGMSNGRIAMGQGFWVKATATSPVLSMTEAVKTATAATGFFKTNAAPMYAFRVSMVQDTLVRDELVFNFDQTFGSAYDKASGDALKLFNGSINIWSKTADGEDLVINNYPSKVSNDTIVLGMTSALGGLYTLEFSKDSLPADMSVFLIDSYRGRIVDVRKEKTWKVLINEDSASFAEGRLKLVFVSQSNTTVLLDAAIKPAASNNQVVVTWNSNQELNTIGYTVEHSIDGNNFAAIGQVTLTDTTIIGNSAYSFTHTSPVIGQNFYRVKRQSSSGFEQYSNTDEINVMHLTNTGTGNSVSDQRLEVFPIPASTNIKIKLPVGISGEAMVGVYSMDGKCQYIHSYAVDNGLTHLDLSVSELPPGVYLLRLDVGGRQMVTRIEKY